MMRPSPFALVLSAVALSFPALPPAARAATTLKLPVCGGGSQTLTIGGRPASPGEHDDHSCCRKGCHAANDRRKKGDGELMPDCC